MSATGGWDAIDAHLVAKLGPATRHSETLVRWADGGPDPLDGISLYDARDHWHYVGFGLSELGPKMCSRLPSARVVLISRVISDRGCPTPLD